ncbi:hypothetical protein Hanom_Chr17g01565191 [Helianthus anomalus]
MTKWQLFLQIVSHFKFIVVMEVYLKDKLMNFRFCGNSRLILILVLCRRLIQWLSTVRGSDWEPLLQGFDHKDLSASWHLHHSSFSGQWYDSLWYVRENKNTTARDTRSVNILCFRVSLSQKLFTETG